MGGPNSTGAKYKCLHGVLPQHRFATPRALLHANSLHIRPFCCTDTLGQIVSFSTLLQFQTPSERMIIPVRFVHVTARARKDRCDGSRAVLGASQVLHLRQSARQQMGDLLRLAASGVFGRVRWGTSSHAGRAEKQREWNSALSTLSNPPLFCTVFRLFVGSAAAVPWWCLASTALLHPKFFPHSSLCAVMQWMRSG